MTANADAARSPGSARWASLAMATASRIAAVTASTLKEEDADLTAAGVDSIVHKPYRAEQILESMERLLAVHFERASMEAVSARPTALSVGAMASMPEALQRSLAEALTTLDSQRIQSLIDEIGRTAPHLASALRERADRYDYESILTLLQSGMPAT